MSRNADALQMQMQNADADAECRSRMQIAGAECIADANCIAELKIRTAPGDISNGLRALGAGPDSIASRIPPGLLGGGGIDGMREFV